MTIREIETRETALGSALYVKVCTKDYRPLPWREAWEAFAAAYPDRWALQTFPPHDRLVDGKAVYHLFVLAPGVVPAGMDISGRAAA